MLPLILGFLGSAFAPAIAGATGIAALASPLLAGSIGAGLGATAQTGDIGEGIKTGLGAYAGGALLGGLMGGTAGGALQQPLPGQSIIGAGANAMTTGTPLTVPASGINALMPPAVATPTALQTGMNFLKTPTGIGALLGTAATAPQPTIKPPKDPYDGSADTEYKPIPRVMNTPPPTYRPGVDPEFDYGISTPYSYADVLNYRDRGVLPYAEGGKTEIEMDEETGAMEAETERPVAGNEKTEIVDAIMAIKGQHPQPEVALGKFLAKYGEDALRDLVDSVQSGEFDETLTRFRSGEKGIVRGPGDGSGKDDKVPATIDGEQDVLLTEGEFVMRKDATDALEKMYGGGFLSAVNKAGERAPEVLKRKVAA